ncbi:MAG: hypothetical protein QOJ25_1643 [Solirubrobacteraceae bacterium]|nr:hypothetical protein [Solirubrobacteraceae bacterium]
MIVATACACASASTANADIVGGGPDETIQQAYGPLMPGQSYAGAFVSSGDADYLAFQVASAGESLSFAVANTTPSCSSPDADFCPVYATLMDQTNQQVGGDGSSAGTVATAGDVEIIAWTFAEPGTYYLLMESNGNLGPGQPSYAVGLAAPADTGPPGPVVKSITVARRQRGNRISARVVLAHAATRLTTTLFALGPHGRQAYIASVTRHPVSARTYALTVGLSAFYRRELARRHQLSLLLKTTITMTSGRRLTYTRRVTLAR